MAPPKKQHAQSNAQRQAQWRERHAGLNKLKVKNWRAAQKALTEEKPAAAASKPKAMPALPHYGEVHYGPVEGVDLVFQPTQPPRIAPIIQSTVESAEPQEPTDEERRVAEKLRQLIERKKPDNLDWLTL